MIATFAIEIALLAVTLWRYRLNPAHRIICLLLLLLATFQLAEFYTCTGSPSVIWSRIGFVAITFLPALSLHLIHIITHRLKWATMLGYITATPWALLFLLPSAFINHACNGNYVIFRLNPQYNLPYLWYYYTWLFIGLAFCLYSLWRSSTNHQQRRALGALAIGYLSFMLPTMVVNTMNPATIYAIPSIMCGFAVLYALLLALVVAPALRPPKKARG